MTFTAAVQSAKSRSKKEYGSRMNVWRMPDGYHIVRPYYDGPPLTEGAVLVGCAREDKWEPKEECTTAPLLDYKKIDPIREYGFRYYFLGPNAAQSMPQKSVGGNSPGPQNNKAPLNLSGLNANFLGRDWLIKQRPGSRYYEFIPADGQGTGSLFLTEEDVQFLSSHKLLHVSLT